MAFVYYAVVDREGDSQEAASMCQSTRVAISISASTSSEIEELEGELAKAIESDLVRRLEIEHQLRRGSTEFLEGRVLKSATLSLEGFRIISLKSFVDHYGERQLHLLREGARQQTVMDEMGYGKNYMRTPAGHRTGTIINEHGHRVPVFKPHLPSFVPQPYEQGRG